MEKVGNDLRERCGVIAEVTKRVFRWLNIFKFTCVERLKKHESNVNGRALKDRTKQSETDQIEDFLKKYLLKSA